MKFAKYHSLGNDFLIVDLAETALPEEPGGLAQRLCDRHTGVGADGLLLISVLDQARGEVHFRIFNSDGSEAEISGNGLRCAAAYLSSQQRIDTPVVRFETRAGVRECRVIEKSGRSAMIQIELGVPRLLSRDIPFDDGVVHERIVDHPLVISGKTYPVTVLSVGNPHCCLFFNRYPSRIEWHVIGREIEHHPFFPQRTNVEFVHLAGKDEIEILFWERGVGETLSSGSGSCAAAVAAILKGLVRRRVTVRTAMGKLRVDWPADDQPVTQTAPAEFAFVGTFLFT